MNIRDHLNRRLIPIYAFMIGCFILFGAGGALAAQVHWSLILVIVGFVGFGACIFYLHYGIRCPKCRNPLGPLALLPKGGYFRLSERICFCPFCGISLDGEVENELASTPGVH